MSERERGFTLIELLVSLAILAIALAVLMGAISSALDTTRNSRDEVLAASLVQSLLARAGTERHLVPGRAEGTYTNGFRWQLAVEPYGTNGDTLAWHINAYRVSATVSWNGGTRALTALRLAPAPSP